MARCGGGEAANGVGCSRPLPACAGGSGFGTTGIWGGAIAPSYTLPSLARALVVAVVAATVGGLYPAWRATRMRPVEALRYE